MGRPPKDKDDLMTAILRIPVTPQQKRLIDTAAKASSFGGMASWARDVLLREASSANPSGASTKVKKRR